MFSLRVLPFFLLGLAFFGKNTDAHGLMNVTAIPDHVDNLVMKHNTSVRITGQVRMTEEEFRSRPVLCIRVRNLDIARPLHDACNNLSLEFERTAHSHHMPPMNMPPMNMPNPPKNHTKAWYSFNGTFYLYGELLGRTDAFVYIYMETDPEHPHETPLIEKYPVTVIKESRFLDHLFTGTIIIFVIFINVGFGCMIDLKVMKEILKKPIVPLLGLACQYIINPVIAYGLLRALSMDTAFSFGMFAFGCSPSGSASNAWTVILKGDIDLSLFVTFASTIAALGMMPLWLFTLGKTLISETIQIPYQNIMISLVSLIVPVLIGLSIHRCLPKVAKFIVRLVKPASAIFLLYVCTFGLYVNAFMFKLVNWKVLVAALTMPFCTFTLGAIVATMCKLSYKRIITIAIETAVQNSGIALVMMLATLPKPDGDIAAVMPIAGSIFTPFPLLFALVGSCVYERCRGSKTRDAMVINEKGDEDKNSTNGAYQNNNAASS